MTTHRSWFPFILVGLSTALLALIVVVYNPDATPVVPNDPVVVVPTDEEYEAAVQQVVSAFMLSSDSEADKAAYDALIAMRVPSVEYQAAHIALVLAFGQMVAGEDVEGNVRLFGLHETYPWAFAVTPPAQE